ncbi:MAG: YeaH/YhbH family protein, partial [Gammaproteobacteria bacterium]
AGDHIKRPPSAGGASGSKASKDGIGEDEFIFEVSREEYLDLYFEDLVLPDMVKKELATIVDYKTVHAGISKSGIPANINIERSMRQATARRIALVLPQRKKLEILQKELDDLLSKTPQDKSRINILEDEIKLLNRRISAMPFIDDIDLRFNYRIKKAMPSNQAIMFCIMDVSGSMDSAKKEIAKNFFIILYLFLKRNYEKIKIVFIRHHTSAKQVDEEEFFFSRETGGTVVSSALELMYNIIQKDFPHNAWNIYAAQASDGDNWNADSPHCKELISNKVLPYVQYFAYLEIMPRNHQSLWEAYSSLQETHRNFIMRSIHHTKDIYPVFRELFKRQLA